MSARVGDVPAMSETVELISVAGTQIAAIKLPPFRKLPDVLIYGERLFHCVTGLRYRECFHYVVPLIEAWGPPNAADIH